MSKEVLKNNSGILDERIRINMLDEETKAVYLGAPVSEHPNYDRSVFIEAILDKTTNEKTLFVPSAKRVDWFRTENPNAVIVTDPPVFNGKSFSIEARIFLSPEDAQSGRLVARTQYNGYISQDVDLNIASTRAKGRALRDLGYDLPRDAHEIPGWTKVKEVEGESGNVDAAESGISAVVVPVPLVPESNNTSQITSAPQQIVQHNEIEPEQPQAKSSTVEEKDSVPAKKRKAAPANNAEVSPTSTPVVPMTNEPTEQFEFPEENPQEETTSVPFATSEASDTQNQLDSNDGTAEPDSIEERAAKMFPNVEDAEGYQCRVLSGKSVGEQPDARIKYFAQKALKGERIIDPALGLACIVVAQKRGLQL